ncbi:MAG: hypothetical protein HC837_16260 [Chloroflexaceae bacterium]|nr:hypothetical protein [Chloroflexaceae bacterium]
MQTSETHTNPIQSGQTDGETRKPYTPPAIIYMQLLKAHALASPLLPSGGPGSVDPELPGKPENQPRDGGSTDPELPPKQPQPEPSGGDGGGKDPALPPKPPKP